MSDKMKGKPSGRPQNMEYENSRRTNQSLGQGTSGSSKPARPQKKAPPSAKKTPRKPLAQTTKPQAKNNPTTDDTPPKRRSVSAFQVGDESVNRNTVRSTDSKQQKPKTARVQADLSDHVASSQKVSNLDRASHIKSTQRKRAITNALFMGVIVLLGFVMTAVAILYVTDYVAAKPNCSFITVGSVEHSVGSTALVVRDEQVFSSTTDGNLVALATEGSRVATSQSIAMVIPEGLEDVSTSLQNVQEQIVDRQRELIAAGNGKGAETVYSAADSEIYPLINSIRADLQMNNLTNLMSYTSSIQVMMDDRDAELQSIDFQDEELSALVTTKEDLEYQLSSASSSLYATIPGIVSYKLDGLETKLTSETVISMMPEDCQKYISSASSSITSNMTVVAGEPSLRICQNVDQFFAVIIDEGTVEEYPLDSTHTIQVPSEDITIDDCKVVRSITCDGGVFVVFETPNQVERLLDRRTIDIEIILSTTEGLRVPISSLLDENYDTNTANILINSSGYASILPVTIVDYDREYAIIAPVSGASSPNNSTIIITNPGTLSEGDKVE